MQTGILCLLVLSIQLLPPLPFYFKLVGSMAAGMMIAAATCAVSIAICWVVGTRRSHLGVLDAGGGGPALIGTVLILVIIHGVVADQMERLDAGRFVASLIPLVFLLAAGLSVSTALRTATAAQIATLSWVSFWVMCAIIAFRLTGLQHGKATFPFTETSHFALALGPVFLYRCATARNQLRKDFWLFLGFAFAIGLKSATFVVVVMLAAFICRRLLIILLVGVAVLAVGLTVELKYFTSRADISNSSRNLSALVYLEGWELLDHSLVQTDGWGVGFQQLGVRGSQVTAAEEIAKLTGGGELNLEDGSFVMAKLGSEFGVAGLILVLAFSVLAFRSALRLRSGRGPPVLNFARSIVVGYGVDMFVRGTGYFTESTLLFVGALLVLAPAGGLLKIARGPRMQHLMAFR
ncbi:MAG: hypothetical protein HIU85_11295 [Proteobacteria bacterium]|nr:hypothetical protein [Pseudomonadota bacterium]